MPADDKTFDLGRVEDATRQLSVSLANLEHGVLSPFQTALLLSSDLNKDLSSYQSNSGRGVEYLSKDVDRQMLSLWAGIDLLITEITRLRDNLKVEQEKLKVDQVKLKAKQEKLNADQEWRPKNGPQGLRATKRATPSRRYRRRGGRGQTKR